MADPIEAKGKLREIAVELDQCSRWLSKVSVELRPVEEGYRDFIRDFKVGLYEQCKEAGERMPSVDMQDALALKEMPAEFRGKYHLLLGKRDGLKQRISDLRAEADAWRSILSADKAELEALG